MKVIALSWAKRIFYYPLVKIIKQGISPESLSVSLALGVTIGLFPLYGIQTFMVGLVAFSLRLNFIAMQIAHYLVVPIQLALIVPFFKIGGAVFKSGSGVSMNFREYFHLFRTDFGGALQSFWLANISAIAIWLIVSIPLFLGLYYVLIYILRKYVLSRSQVHS